MYIKDRMNTLILKSKTINMQSVEKKKKKNNVKNKNLLKNFNHREIF